MTTLQGTCSFRTVSEALTISDETIALTYAAEFAPEALVTKTTLSGEAYRLLAEAKLKETGELLPGVQNVAAHESFSVKFGKGE